MGQTYGSAWVGEVINKEPVLSKVRKCNVGDCWYGIIEYNDYTVGLCPKCSGTGVAHFNTGTCYTLKMMFNSIIDTFITLVFRKRKEREI